MSQCDRCGKYAEEVWPLPDEMGRSEYVCDRCLPQPARLDVTGEAQPRCPVCRSAKCREVSDRYWFRRAGGLFQCELGHLFTVRSGVRTLTEEVWVPDD
jgi:hypothetical protein